MIVQFSRGHHVDPEQIIPSKLCPHPICVLQTGQNGNEGHFDFDQLPLLFLPETFPTRLIPESRYACHRQKVLLDYAFKSFPCSSPDKLASPRLSTHSVSYFRGTSVCFSLEILKDLGSYFSRNE